MNEMVPRWILQFMLGLNGYQLYRAVVVCYCHKEVPDIRPFMNEGKYKNEYSIV